MGISIEEYRCRIGCFGGGAAATSSPKQVALSKRRTSSLLILLPAAVLVLLLLSSGIEPNTVYLQVMQDKFPAAAKFLQTCLNS